MSGADEKLLELVVKAADVEYGMSRIYGGISLTDPDGRHRYLPWWNPLECDDDAFTLLVGLGITFRRIGHKMVALSHGQYDEYAGDDPYAAARRAIVRAAAEIGRMK